MLSFDNLNDIPPWIKTGVTLLFGAGAAKVLGVVLENRRLAKKEYRDTLLGRIRELEAKMEQMYKALEERALEVARLKDDLEECKRLHAQRRGPKRKA